MMVLFSDIGSSCGRPTVLIVLVYLLLLSELLLATTSSFAIRSQHGTNNNVNNNNKSNRRWDTKKKLLVVGATGTTGIRALRGLLDVGYCPENLILLTRNPTKPKIQQLQQMGIGMIHGDLEDVNSLLQSCTAHDWEGCYIHSTSSDTPELDTLEVQRAKNLCTVLLHAAEQQNQKREPSSFPMMVVYNSAACKPGHGVKRNEQKHAVERVFQDAIQQSLSDNTAESSLLPRYPPLAFVSLRANIFMEELWKNYTRPSILDGTYPLPVHRFKKIYLTSVRDMGRLAGLCIQRNAVRSSSSETSCDDDRNDIGTMNPTIQDYVRIQNVAGDHLTGTQIAKAFGQAQQSPCRYVNNRELTKRAKREFHELYEQIRFLQTNTERTDISSLRQEFGKEYITSFPTFLAETQWGDRSLWFEDLSNVDTLNVIT